MNRTHRFCWLSWMAPALCLALNGPLAQAVDLRDLVEEVLDQPAEGVLGVVERPHLAVGPNAGAIVVQIARLPRNGLSRQGNRI